ncbi:hypothetical protein CAI16_12095 [Virgibacillus dokdonensis]|uniref:Uncharacterized protein n=1 Tax=Virgibacillus dokdonensis TaxID=302167 RepID=A0A3E0WPU7_9BACI|nr:hypothetical protein [Virgibacillus dokdonensis]RFA34223.1 hypothetical protein CAI16_12095 [Virgibacillus dokdonensis]
MSILPKWLYSTILLSVIFLVIAGYKSDNMELPKRKGNPPNEFDTPNSESSNDQKGSDSDMISEEDPFPDKDTKLPENPIPKEKIEKRENNKSKDNTIEKKDSPVKNDD